MNNVAFRRDRNMAPTFVLGILEDLSWKTETKMNETGTHWFRNANIFPWTQFLKSFWGWIIKLMDTIFSTKLGKKTFLFFSCYICNRLDASQLVKPLCKVIFWLNAFSHVNTNLLWSRYLASMKTVKLESLIRMISMGLKKYCPCWYGETVSKQMLN